MRIALVNLTSGGLSGGYRKYLEIVPPLLAQHADVTHLEVLSPANMRHELAPRIAEWRWSDRDARQGYPALRARLNPSTFDVAFFPTARLVHSALPTVVMVRNMEPLVAPFAGNSVLDGARNVARYLAAWRSVRQADRVIAVSDFVRDYLVGRWRIPQSRIGVVPHGIEPPLAPAAWTRPLALGEDARGATLFTAGSIRPSRGLEDALEALDVLTRRGVEATLWVAGAVAGDAQRYHDALRRSIARLGLAERVRWLGGLTRAEMSWCFANCDVFVMTSRVEACPNTALEAMSYGARSVATRNRPMPETFGDAASYYAAGRGVELADAIGAMLTVDAAARSARSRQATARAAEFNWRRTADATIRELQSAVSGLT